MRYQTIECERTRFQAKLILPDAGPGVTISETVAEEITDCCRELSLDDELRVVTITGGGDTFATGRERPPGELKDADLAERVTWFKKMGAVTGFVGSFA